MLRFLLQWLGLVALLLSPVPALAAPVATQPAASAAAEQAVHCEESDAASGQARQQDGTSKDDPAHPCCKDSMKGCCAMPAAAMDNAQAGVFGIGTADPHSGSAARDLAQAAASPPTEPPIFA